MGASKGDKFEKNFFVYPFLGIDFTRLKNLPTFALPKIDLELEPTNFLLL